MRYAIYFVPATNHSLWELGNLWLGRNPETGGIFIQPCVSGCSPDEIKAVTIAPRRYGLHATIKPPFQLARGHDEAELIVRLKEFCAIRQSFELPHFEVATLDDFIALKLIQPNYKINELADACVAEFDNFRSPPDENELARRKPETLSDSGRANLARWGYPHVFEDFRFHITLTQSTTPDQRVRLLPWLADYFATALVHPCRVDGLALYVEPFSDAALQLVRRFPFAEDVGE